MLERTTRLGRLMIQAERAFSGRHGGGRARLTTEYKKKLFKRV